MTRPYRSTLALLLALVPACAAQDGDGAGFEGALDFRGELPFLPGFDHDSGWLPAASPVAVRASVAAGGAVTVTQQAITDGETLMPVAGSGLLSVEGSLSFEVSAQIDTSGLSFEGVVDSFEYALEPASTVFEPFAIGAPATVSTMLPPAELGRVPIGALPGATLVLEITGGTIDTAFAGTCAEAAEGVGQLAGVLTMSGTVACAATVEIEIPLVGSESFGPFAIDVPIPAIETPVELGARSLQSGEAVPDASLCAGGGTSGNDDAADGGATGGAGETGSAGDATGPSEGGASEGGASEGSTSEGSASDAGTSMGGGESTAGSDGDPDYPRPDAEGNCPGDEVAAGIDVGPANGVCLPPCGPGASCPSGQSGAAQGYCGINPDSSLSPCMAQDDCPVGEGCTQGTCTLPPTHCVLLCEVDAPCPIAMICLEGVCVYEL